MAKQIQLNRDIEINGVSYPKGTTITVCDELFNELGIPEYVPSTVANKKEK